MDASEAAAIIDKAVPFFFVLMAVELVASRVIGRAVYRLGDSIADLALGSVSQLVGLATKIPAVLGFALIGSTLSIQVLAGAPAIPDGNPFGAAGTDWATLGWWVLAFALIDHQYYWAHRFTHHMNLAWGAHVAHHSSEEYNLAVALRQSSTQTLFTMWFQFPLAVLGFTWLHFTVCMGINLLYQFWIHTRLIGRLGPLEWVMNTPSHHRVHHGRDPKYIDKNHAGVFIVWDRMYGSFQVEEEEPHYGVTTQLTSFNPVWSNLHHYAFVWRTFRAARGLRDKLGVLFRKTGWRPDYLGGPMVPPEVSPDHVKYQPEVPRWVKVYAVVHFAVAVVISLQVTRWAGVASGAGLLGVAGAALFAVVSFSNVAAMFDARAWVPGAEAARLAVMLAAGAALVAFAADQPLGWMLAATGGGSLAFIVAAVAGRGWRWRVQCASAQLRPTPTATTSGTRSG